MHDRFLFGVNTVLARTLSTACYIATLNIHVVKSRTIVSQVYILRIKEDPLVYRMNRRRIVYVPTLIDVFYKED